MTGGFSRLPGDFRAALSAELASGERILYSGQPDWCAEWGKLLAILLFALFWSAIAFLFFLMSLGGLLGLVAVKSEGSPASSGLLLSIFLFSLPFVAIGIVALAAPFLSVRKSRNTVHAVTNARLLSVFIGPDQGAESYPFDKINFVKRRDRRNGTGTLEIGYGVEKDSDGDPRPLTLDWSGVPEAKHAEALIREQAKWVR